ncbi:MAG: zinc-binding dehydrogenase [Myxococcota bacterium]
MSPRAVVICTHGGPEALRVVPIAIPKPGRGEVVVAVRTAGVAFADVYGRLGIYPGSPPVPFSPGFDVVGVIDAVGEGGDDGAIGQRVGCIIERGGYSTHVVCPADRIVPIPDELSDEVAVALLLNYVTAYQMLHHMLGLKRGDTVFAHALAGGVGTAVLDLAGPLGLSVTGTASSAKHALVRQLGGDPIDYRREDFVGAALRRHPQGYDGVLDGIGGAHICRSNQLRAKTGRIVGYGFQSATTSTWGRLAVAPTLLRTALLAIRSCGRAEFYAIMRFNQRSGRRLRDDISEILAWARNGDLTPLVSDVLPLEDAAEAHRRLEAGEVRGKLVLRVH